MVSRSSGRPEVRDHPHRTTSTSLAGTDVDAAGRRLFPRASRWLITLSRPLINHGKSGDGSSERINDDAV
jgi:hypothetical protein